jgi:hypothetical protein
MYWHWCEERCWKGRCDFAPAFFICPLAGQAGVPSNDISIVSNNAGRVTRVQTGRPGRKSTFLQRAGWIRLDDTLDPYSLSRSRKSATGTGIGALSVGTGTLDVSGVRRDGEVEIGWREQGIPVVEPPASSDGLWHQISPSGSLAV